MPQFLPYPEPILEIYSRIPQALYVHRSNSGGWSMEIDPEEFKDRYEEYARKMDAFMNGPTTTYFQQLLDAGIELPEPASLSDADVRPKLWEVIAGLDKLRAFLERTNHLNDRELYAKLWYEVLRGDTPAIDEIGFSSHLDLVRAGEDDADTQVYLKYYADEADRDRWRSDFPADNLPAREALPFTRDDLLPGPMESVAEASAWLRANWNERAFAANRFGTTANAIKFVDELYASGAIEICVDNVVMLPNDDWTPYADTLLVRMPEDHQQRSAIFELMKHIGKPDDDGGDDHLLIDLGQKDVRLWWD